MKEEKPAKVDNKQIFICERCRYKFKYSAKSGRALVCPYCGKSDKIIEDVKQSAENLIQKSQDPEFYHYAGR